MLQMAAAPLVALRVKLFADQVKFTFWALVPSSARKVPALDP